MSNAPAPTPEPGERNLGRALLLALAAASFLLHLALAHHLDAVEAVGQYDVFFHADTQARLDCVVEGACDHRSSISHPGLDVFVNPPVRTLARIATGLGAWGGDVAAARHAIALTVSPLFAGLQTALVFLLCIELGLTRGQALLASGLASISLSAILFGSLPESFALSSCGIAAGFWMAARAALGKHPRFVHWVALATFATGVTVTNLASIAVLFAAARQHAGDAWPTLLRGVAKLTATSLAATFLLALTSVALYDSRPLSLEAGKRYIAKWSENNDPATRLARFPTALANSVAGVAPDLAPNYQGQLKDSRYKFRFSYETTASAFSTARPLALVLLVTALLGAGVLLRSGDAPRNAALAAFAILLGNAILHAFWGVGHFLYSQHWQLAFCLLLLGPMFLEGRARMAGTAAVAGIALSVALQNWTVVRLMLAHFSPPPGL